MPDAATTQTAATPWGKSSDAEREILNRVGADVESFERGIGQDFKERCERFYRGYRGFRKFADAWTQDPRDRDALVYDAKRHWGSHLHIPLTYRQIEDGVPKAIAHRPRLLVIPRRPSDEINVENVRLLIDAQAENVDIELAFQDVLKAGYIYGLGVGKALWRKEYAYKRVQRRRMFRSNEFRQSKLLETCTFDDPDFEDVDPFDFMWDPFGSSIRTCKWVLHRNWLGLNDVMERLQSGVWNTESAKRLTEEEVRSMGNSQKYDEVWQQRMEASGFSSFHASVRGEQIHEVWEWHDGHRINTVLDRGVLVQGLDDRGRYTESPCVGQIPFMVYRPTKVPKQMVGIGEIEPMEHLQRELDTLRSQRRDAATLALAAGYAFDPAAVDEEDLQFGPLSAIEVRNADVRSALMPLQRQEVPGSSYKDEEVIRGDIDAIGGANDQLLNPQVSGTATEAQLVQAAVSMRVGLKSRRFEVEVVRQVCRAWLRLNQRMITTERDPMRLPEVGLTMAEAAQEGRWRWFDIGPGELQGEYTIIPEGGSMAAPNVQENIQLANMMLGPLSQNPYVDPRRPLMRALTLLGEKDPQSWLKQAEAPIPPKALEILTAMGTKPELIQFAIQQAQAQDPMLNPEQQGPQTADLEQMGMAA
jgi:hypothetical protein